MMHTAIHSRYASNFLWLVLYWIVAAASVSGSLGKWGLRDATPAYGIEEVLDERASRPFAYRRLLPELADAADTLTPAVIKNYLTDKLSPHRTFARATSAADPTYAFRYLVIVYACFGATLATLFLLTTVLRRLDFSTQTAALAPVGFVLAFPYVQTGGGYYYDMVELCFLAGALLAALRGRWLVLCLLAVPATLNKEAFVFFLPALYPVLRARLGVKPALACLAGAIAISGAVNVWIKWIYAASPGDVAHLQFLNNIYQYLGIRTYLELEVTYGIVGPSGAFIVTLLLLATVAMRAWPSCPLLIRQHLALAALLNLPLFAVFCAPGELRNLSLLFVGFVVLIACVIEPKANGMGTPTQCLPPPTSKRCLTAAPCSDARR